MKQFEVISETEMEKLSDLKKSDFKLAIDMLSFPKERWVGIFCKLNVMFYIDRFGDFFSRDTKTARIVKALYNSFSKPDQQEITNYIMDLDDDE